MARASTVNRPRGGKTKGHRAVGYVRRPQRHFDIKTYPTPHSQSWLSSHRRIRARLMGLDTLQ